MLLADAVENIGFRPDAMIISALAGIILPLIVAVITKELAQSWVKAVLLAVLAAITGTISTWTQFPEDAQTWQAFAISIVTAAVAAWSSYASLWRPTVAPKVQSATSSFGIGKSA